MSTEGVCVKTSHDEVTIQVGTPPRRLVKTPSRATLSPKGERSCEKIKKDRKFLTN
jgi:hypothetical protein